MGWQESLKSSSSCRKHRDTSCGRKGCQENKMWQPSRYKLHVLRRTHYTSWGPGKKNFSHGFLFPGKHDSRDTLSAIIPSHHDERSLGRQKPSNSRGGGSLNSLLWHNQAVCKIRGDSRIFHERHYLRMEYDSIYEAD